MRTPPTVSIVLPTRNRLQRLPGAIESCLGQSYRCLELIVVDDGSTDDTPSCVAAFADGDSRVRYLRNDPSRRLPGALNRGFSIATGEYWTWTSDDNRFEPDAIQVMLEAMQHDECVSLVYCDYWEVDESAGTTRLVTLPEPDRLWEQACVGACFLYRASVAGAVGPYDEKLFLAEDYDYWLRIASVGRIQHLSGVAPYRYTLHEGALTESRRAEVLWALRKLRLKHCRSLSRVPGLVASLRSSAVEARLRGLDAQRRGERDRAWQWYLLAARLWLPSVLRWNTLRDIAALPRVCRTA